MAVDELALQVWRYVAEDDKPTPSPKPGKRIGRPPGSKNTKKDPPWRSNVATPLQYLPSEKVAKKEVDMDLLFRRAMQFTEWMMDRMEAEIDQSALFAGVPVGFGAQMRELSSALNTLSLSHARWIKANEEMYERLSDDEKLAALGKYIPALYLRHPKVVTDWMRTVALAIQATSKSKTHPRAEPATAAAILEVAGLEKPKRPEWKTIAAQVREDFRQKRDARFGPPPSRAPVEGPAVAVKRADQKEYDAAVKSGDIPVPANEVRRPHTRDWDLDGDGDDE